MRWLVVVLTITLLVSLPLAGGPPMTRLRVEVKDLKDRPIERASVIVRFQTPRSIKRLGIKSKKQWETRTSQDGVASFPSMPQGTVTILVIAKNYQTFGGEFDILEAEKTIQIKLNPPQPQYTAHP
jgi:hypothetical protein